MPSLLEGQVNTLRYVRVPAEQGGQLRMNGVPPGSQILWIRRTEKLTCHGRRVMDLPFGPEEHETLV